RPLKDIRDEYNYPKKKGIKDECSRLLEASTMKSRRGFAIQRLMNAMRQAHADGWFIVFDTLTLADDRLEAFYRSEERFSRNAETELVCRLLLEKKKLGKSPFPSAANRIIKSSSMPATKGTKLSQ